MNVTTTHNYIDRYKIHEDSTKLIIGTIHPHKIENFRINFFYGKTGIFWDILKDAFPHQKFGNKEEIIETLKYYKISISDIIRQCDRYNANITADSKLYNIIDNSINIEEGLKKSKIDTIYFTSRFGKNNAAKLFIDIFKINYNFDHYKNEFIISQNYFGREIRAVVLYSPSKISNIGISKSLSYLNKSLYYKQFKTPIKQFKIDFYKEKFDFLTK